MDTNLSGWKSGEGLPRIAPELRANSDAMCSSVMHEHTVSRTAILTTRNIEQPLVACLPKRKHCFLMFSQRR